MWPPSTDSVTCDSGLKSRPAEPGVSASFLAWASSRSLLLATRTSGFTRTCWIPSISVPVHVSGQQFFQQVAEGVSLHFLVRSLDTVKFLDKLPDVHAL